MASHEISGAGATDRERVVRVAAELIAEQGAAISLDDIRAATGASRSQLYRYFGDDHGFVAAVVEYRCATVIAWHAQALASVSTWEGLERWAEVLVEEHSALDGCPIGRLAAVLSDSDEKLRSRLSEAFGAWTDAIRGALLRLRENGLLSADADLDSLATLTLSAIQGGLLLAKLTRDVEQLRTSLAGAIVELRAHETGHQRSIRAQPLGPRD